MESGKLYIVSTPIGNLEDITFRAVKILSEVDLILCEDTRKTKVLLEHYNVNKKLVSYYNYNELERVKEIIPFLKSGKDIAVVSNGGTPCISDPGFLMVRECVENSIEVVPVPGPVAFVNAIVASGLPSNKILFLGFLPKKELKIKKIFETINLTDLTVAFYESPKRIYKTFEILLKYLNNDIPCVIAKEMTKVFEEYFRGSIKDVYDEIKSRQIRGELVVLLYFSKN